MRNKREAVRHISIVIVVGFAALGQLAGMDGPPRTARNVSAAQELLDASHKASDLSQLGSYVLNGDVHVETEINGQHEGRLTIYRDHDLARFEIQFGQSTDLKVQTKDKIYISPQFSFIDAIGLDGFDRSWVPRGSESQTGKSPFRFSEIKPTRVAGLEMRCVEREFTGTNPLQRVRLCFDSQQPLLRSVAWGPRLTEFLDYTQQDSVLLPTKVKMHGPPFSVEIDHITVVQKPLDPSLFAPLTNALELERCENQQPPRALYTPEPSYADVARSKSIQGTVVFGALINKKGKVENPRVLISLDPELDLRAKKAVLGWKFKPSTCGGQPVEAAMTLEVFFRLF